MRIDARKLTRTHISLKYMRLDLVPRKLGGAEALGGYRIAGFDCFYTADLALAISLPKRSVILSVNPGLDDVN